MARWTWMGVCIVGLAGCANEAPPDAADGGRDADGGMDAHVPEDASDDGSAADAQAVEAGAETSDAADASPDGSDVACVTDQECDDANECTCNSALPDGGCRIVLVASCTPCAGGAGLCGGGLCLASNCDVFDDCKVGVCIPDDTEFECGEEPKADCTPCSDGAGVCSGGECVTDTCPAACDPQDCPEP
jgi:hypothetical protein